MDGIIYGYDPGGDGKHGLARLMMRAGKPVSLEVSLEKNTHRVLNKIESGPQPLALGIDTLTAWSTGTCGWRPADDWLRRQYAHEPRVAKSVVSPNGLFGSMGLNGMSVAVECRRLWLELFITETHPKVLYYALTKKVYRDVKVADRLKELVEWLGSPAELIVGSDKSCRACVDDEWDAGISAYAAWQSLSGNWKRDLHGLPVSDDEGLVHPAGRTHYHWPD